MILIRARGPLVTATIGDAEYVIDDPQALADALAAVIAEAAQADEAAFIAIAREAIEREHGAQLDRLRALVQEKIDELNRLENAGQ